MSDSDVGILYTQHSDLRAATPVASLWSYETSVRGPDRRPVALNRHGNSEYWLERWDPFLNTILPGTGVSVVFNFGDPWAAGRSLAASAFLPPLCVIGPVTRPRILRVGRRVDAVGAVLPPALTLSAFGVPASELVDRLVALEDLWMPSEVERLFESLSIRHIRQRMSELRSELVTRIEPPGDRERVGHCRVLRSGAHDQRVPGFAGSSPTVFFQPHDDAVDPGSAQLRGRPSEWLRRPNDDDSHDSTDPL